jgi:hypothetical protein
VRDSGSLSKTAVQGVEHTINHLQSGALGRQIRDDQAKVVARPDHFGVEADAEVEHPLSLDTGGRPSDGGIQLVRRQLRTDRLEVAGRVEVELVTVGSVDRVC